MKKTIVLLICILPIFCQAQTYNFAAIAPSGQTLYYYIGSAGWLHNNDTNTWEARVVSPAGNGFDGNWDGYTKPIGNMVIPSSVIYNNHTIPVTIIQSQAFCECDGLTSVTIPNSVIRIGSSAFYGCTGLLSVTIGNSVTVIEEGAFTGCDFLTQTNYTGTIAQWCSIRFHYCTSNPIYYSHNFFINNEEVTNLVLPATITSVGEYAFYSCNGLISLTIPSSVSCIDSYAFRGCSELTSIVVDSGNAVYDSRDNCNAIIRSNDNTLILGSLSTIIPNSVTNISSYSFAFFDNCGLTEITSLATIAPTLSANAFFGVPSTIPVNIPCGSSMSYYSRWNYFSNFIESDGYSFEAITSDSTKGKVDILVAPTCTMPTAAFNAVAYEGYTFSHWSDGNNENPRVMTVVSDTIVVAYFENTTQAIDNVDALKDIILLNNGQIVVEGSNGNRVTLYDATGLILATKQKEYSPLHFDVPATGIYLVKIGNHSARKVVVIR